jgi:hypothetical protein
MSGVWAFLAINNLILYLVFSSKHLCLGLKEGAYTLQIRLRNGDDDSD